MKKIILFSYILYFFVVASASAGGRAPSGKPLSPLRITIAPVQAGLTPEQIGPGDTVELRITVVSVTDVQQMQVEVKPLGGAKIIAGETSWNGPAGRNEEKNFIITSQAPVKGAGRIKASVHISSSSEARFSSEVQFEFGRKTGNKNKSEKQPSIKKDSKGRRIIEYQ